jgi:hypothetical protein
MSQGKGMLDDSVSIPLKIITEVTESERAREILSNSAGIKKFIRFEP